MNRLHHTAGSDQSGLDEILVDANPFGLAANPGDDFLNLRAKPPIPLGFIAPQGRLSQPNSTRGGGKMRSKKKRTLNFERGVKGTSKSQATTQSDQDSNQTVQTNPNSIYRKHYNQSLKFFVWVI